MTQPPREFLSTVSVAALLPDPEVSVTIADPFMDWLAQADAARLFALHSMGRAFETEREFDVAADKVFAAAGVTARRAGRPAFRRALADCRGSVWKRRPARERCGPCEPR